MLYFASTIQLTSAQPSTEPACGDSKSNDATCKFLPYFDRPQTVQCVSQNKLSRQDMKVLKMYCDNGTCNVPCEYDKRKRIIGSVHDECSCVQTQQQQQQQQQRQRVFHIRANALNDDASKSEKKLRIAIDCQRSEDLYKTWCREDEHGNSTLMFCLDSSIKTQSVFGFRCHTMPRCDFLCSAAAITSKGKLNVQRKDCYCYKSNSTDNYHLGKWNFKIIILYIYWVLLMFAIY